MVLTAGNLPFETCEHPEARRIAALRHQGLPKIGGFLADTSYVLCILYISLPTESNGLPLSRGALRWAKPIAGRAAGTSPGLGRGQATNDVHLESRNVIREDGTKCRPGRVGEWLSSKRGLARTGRAWPEGNGRDSRPVVRDPIGAEHALVLIEKRGYLPAPGSGWKKEDKTITRGGVLSAQAGLALPHLRS